VRNKGKVGRIGKNSLDIISILLLGVILVVGQHAVPIYAADEPIDVTVTVTSTSPESYGKNVLASSRVFLSRWALGEPDSRGAWMLWRGWVSIELEDVITDCGDISIWTAKRGWKSSVFKVYASVDGSNWKHIGGGKCTTRSYTRYDFSGAFGDVKYIKVQRNASGRWSTILLDAVRAKGGDA